MPVITGTIPADKICGHAEGEQLLPSEESPQQFETREEYFAWFEEQKKKRADDTESPAPVDFTKDPEIAAFIELKVQEGIQKALQGKPPRANTTKATEQERKDFNRMGYKERLKLYTTDPLTYNKLAKGAI